MGVVIRFPAAASSQKFSLVTEKIKPLHDDRHLDSTMFSEEEDQAFMALVREWPCFAELESPLSLEELFELYYDDELSQSQDCALEFIFHMHDPDSRFDISNALYTWEEEDRRYFFSSLSMHAELIDLVKQEELRS